ncbi:MAG: exodeoxyribonuclease V subunit beta [Desulfobacterales bacterium]|nr:exodeoxyribonuclease V subunit beta [Desulfobacterales bacterium]
MKSFDPLNTPLTGTNLIEASAGTGKTHAIEGLFLRLLIELRLSVEEILVVTFTKAATEELKNRIRTRLTAVQAALAQGSSDDLLINALIQKNRGEIRQLLQNALMNFDQAAIFTIHGFCQRILHEHAFETGSLFDTELITDQRDLLRGIADDFWRNHFYRTVPEVVHYAIEKLKGPEYFLKLMERWQATDIKIVPRVAKPFWQSLPPYRAVFEKLRNAWPESRAAVAEAFNSPSLKDNIYGSLKLNKTGAEHSVREIKVMALLSEMDGFSSSPGYVATIFKDIDKFTTTKLLRSVKSGRPAPHLTFFDLCDELVQKKDALAAELETYLLYLKTEFFQYADRELSIRKKENNVQFFDDLLLKVKNALADTAGNSLAAAIRRKYKAALVDEFQDTDPVQYDVFSRLFSSEDHVLFMIGDPKQAIYGFRGADIFTYMRASRTAPRKYTLTENWRSEQGMINAVNTMFQRVKSPFLFRDIGFSKGTSGRQNISAGDTPKPAMTIWHLKGDAGKPISKKNATEIVAAQVAAEIVHLLNAEPEPIAAGDMAVLVRTNRQAQLIKTVLSQARVPAVLYSTGNIFRSHEAMEMERLLASVSEPMNDRRLRAALVTDMMGGSAEMICRLEEGTTEWESRRLRMREYYHLWEKHGFMRMMRQMLINEEIRTRLLTFPDGERRLTNVLHLAELLQHESTENKKGLTALIKWLAEQRKDSTPGMETHQLRLESDADAIKIVTIHKSKGLEYPVVFCPFLWDGSLSQKEELFFHDPVDEGMTLDLSADKDAAHLSISARELLAENIRLLYVAITRAKKRCYLAWGRINTAETAPLAYLFHHAPDGPDEDIVAALHREISQKSDAEINRDLHKLAESSAGSVEIVELPERPVAGSLTVSPKGSGKLHCRTFSGKIDWGWRVLSYSTLVSQAVPTETLPDRDATVTTRPETGAELAQRNIFSFPKGGHAGNFFHDIFENFDFNNTDDAYCSRLVEIKLAEYGFEPAWKETVCRTIQNVVSLPLKGNGSDFTLSVIPKSDRLHELEFYFPLASLSPRKLKRVFKDCGIADVPDQFPEGFENLVFAPVKGFMKGFMDLVFRFQDRFYLIDWKSNFLGPTLQDYRRSALVNVMRNELYFLQYQIYTLAVHQYLQRRIAGYRYEKNFGGVFYIFLRGVAPVQGMEFGIFRDIPPPDSVYALAKALIP